MAAHGSWGGETAGETATKSRLRNIETERNAGRMFGIPEKQEGQDRLFCLGLHDAR